MLTKLTSRRKKNIDGRESSPSGIDNGTSKVPQTNLRSSLTIAPTDGRRDPSPSGRIAESGALGLNVIYTPDNGRKVDIVFVHGLGGTSKWTWSKHKSPELFWPLTFLPLEPDICLARILTFGYNASFQKPSSAVVSVLDFAKDLLFDLKYGKDKHMDELDMGKVPIIFVVHSMGGLIVKEAFMQGQNDPEFESIIKAITAIIFLATPHRGTALAQTLNRILDSIMVNSKQYVAELGRNSLTLQKLNEQFRHVATRLDIVSFYETLPTPIGLRSARVMVLEKESSVLGYPGEVSKALAADHHGVCKYEGPEDPNYVTVRNVLKSLVSKVIAKDNAKRPELSDRRAALDLKSILALSELPGLDYIFFRDQWTEDTNNWINHDKSFLQWRDSLEQVSVLWISGGAATGKSVLASTIINNLVEKGFICQYFFIRFGDRKKRSLSFLIRSLAYQIAQSVPSLMQRLATLVDENIDFENVDPKLIWDRLFKSILFKFEAQQPWYWVIDGLDEADDPRAVIKLLLDISSALPIRILFMSRQNSDIMASFERRPKRCSFRTISIDGHVDDIRVHVRQELRVSGSDDLMDWIERRIVEGSQNNFLWAHLAVERVNQCYTQEDIESALRELPEGMEALYDRMAMAVSEISSPRDKALAINILQCLVCSLRVLSLSELAQALGKVAAGIMDLPRTIRDLCADFAVVDNEGNVSIVHQTARDYLLDLQDRNFSIDRKAAHKQMYLSCINCLMSPGLRAKLGRNQQPEFLDYAASSWSSHLRQASLDHEVATTLKTFLTRPWVLTWIQGLAATGQLRVLIPASKDLSKVASLSTAVQQGWELAALDQELLSSWSVDLLRVVGRFSGPLQRRPDSIYGQIPPFCPKGSAIHQYFGKSGALSVSGLSSERWDDLLSRISLGKSFASSIQTAGSLVGTLAAPGKIYLHECSDFRESKCSPISHGERVDRFHLNKAATVLVTYGYRTTKVWKISTGECIISVESVETKTRPLDMLFTDNDSRLLVGTADRRVRLLSLVQPKPAWETIAELDEEMELEKHFTNSASHMALSPDGSLVAVAYRRHPVSAWELDGPMHIGHCRRQDETAMVREIRDLVWHPYQPEVLGLNVEGVVFKWAPYEDTIDELTTGATRLSTSNDGELFVTGDAHGRVKLYTTSSFSLLHQVSAQDGVFDLAFSPDSKRFYDIRGYHANAWEPTALAKYANHARSDADSVSEFSTAQGSELSDASITAIDPITALSGSPTGRLYCVGTQMGVLSLHDLNGGRLENLYVSRAKFSIEHIAWSDDGKHICCSDFSKLINVFAISQDLVASSPICEPKATISIRQFAKGPITQMLFHSESKHILLHTSTQLHAISLSSYTLEKSRELNIALHRCILHPGDSNLIIGFGPSNILVLDWNLVVRQKYVVDWQEDPPTNETSTNDACQIERALITHDRKHVLLQTLLPEDRSRKRQFYFLEVSTLSCSHVCDSMGEPQATQIRLNRLAHDFCREAALALGFLRGDRLLYTSYDFAICSVQTKWTTEHASPSLVTKFTEAKTTAGRRGATRSQESGIKEYYALPGDWISNGAMAACSYWPVERSLLYPRNGEAAVVRCAALA